ncbi:MAG: tRNA pseudouridine(38-40) synthase TruA [Actinomycetia bacterium]|nr:tRNA pseudouridine(38-40) synthase TruA [Actinomycetes bacterium]
MPTYRLDLAYDGSRFHGYARQPNVRTVQGELEEALGPHTGGAGTFVAGRTDKGVHATEQIVSFRCAALDTGHVMRSLNSRLAPEIAVHRLIEVSDGFHARFSATGRAYRYRIRNAEVHDPLSAASVWTVADPLDVDAMNVVAAAFVGEHDFAAFCRRLEDRSLIREVFWARWCRNGDRIDLSIGARSFCHQMVRSIVALCVEVGRGNIDASDVPEILESLDRRRAKGVAPPHGLALVAVAYDDEPLPRPSWVATTS